MHELLQYRTWALNESYFNRLYPVISNAIAKGHNLIQKKSIKDYFSRIQMLYEADPSLDKIMIGWGGDFPVVKVNGKNIAMIPIIGPLTKYGDACSVGMQDYSLMINAVMKSPDIDGLVLIMDTPGGTVDGTPEMGLTIKNAGKPIGVFGDGMVASAGMWIAAQADVIIGNQNNPTEFGSIGVLMMHEDWSKVEEAGNTPKVTIIRAPGSENKALVNNAEPLTDELMKAVKADLKSTRADFVDAVKSGRGDKLNADYPGLFSGDMFDVNASKAAGLIDAKGTLQTALNKVAELAKQKGKPSYQGTNSNANTMKFPKISSLFGSKSKEAKDVDIKVTSEGLQSEDTASLEAAEKKMADMEAESLQLKEQNEQHKTKVTALEQSVTELQAQVKTIQEENSKTVATLNEKITAQEKENTDLKAKLAKAPTGPVVTITSDPKKEAQVNGDPSEVKKTMEKYQTSVDEQAAEIRKTNQAQTQLK